MPGLYSDDILDEVARANDIVGVIQGYFPLKRAGKDYKALCPFHPEKTPSFTVSPAKQIFKCFGCGAGGSVFNFIMMKENVTFPEAVRILAERAGVRLKTDPEARKRAGRVRRLRKVLDRATRLFEAALKDEELGRPAREYLAGRGFEEEVIERFRIGYAPPGWDRLLKKAEQAGVEADLLEAAGLVTRRDDGSGLYDRFRNRVIFPILDTLSRPVAFGGRTLGDDPAKYLNSPETALFRKAEHLYGLPQARPGIEQERRAVVVEGYTDVVMAHQAGMTNVVATLGTALTADHVRTLKRYADDVVLVFDSDAAGQRAADRAVELFLAEDVGVYVTELPEGKDPFDVCREEGAEGFASHLAEATEALEYKWKLVRNAFGADASPAAKRRALEAMLESLARAPALTAGEPGVRGEMLLGRIGQTLGVSQDALRRELARVRRRAKRSAAGMEVGAALPEKAAEGRRWAAERDILTALVHWPSRTAEVAEALPGGVRSEPLRPLYEALASLPKPRDCDIQALARQLEDPETSGLAVELHEQGEAFIKRQEMAGTDPLGDLLEQRLAEIRRMEAEVSLAAQGEAAREMGDADVRALRDFDRARKGRRGFLPPGETRRRNLGG